MTDAARASHRPAARWRKPVLVALFLALVGAFVWQQLPTAGYATDLSRVGQGRPALVLAYDSNFTSGMGVMELLNDIRDDYEERVQFLVAHLATPTARDFASRHGAADGTVLLFAGNGERIATLHQPQTAEELRRALAQALR